ncbi:hypothetical protein [Bacillus mobilis]|uniref:hypothetical protein n=1 Tax=Bacillus mobilis TaxID=2026190 RepID=UPI002E1EE8C6|nr:hypothetical protein [Bacillus mobilis]MED0956306.1 hypothetical protein [Bacillus mobilis]
MKRLDKERKRIVLLLSCHVRTNNNQVKDQGLFAAINKGYAHEMDDFQMERLVVSNT